ncbi:MAG: hypothetical protein C4321_03245, partial [Chloroflexota bacterium]
MERARLTGRRDGGALVRTGYGLPEAAVSVPTRYDRAFFEELADATCASADAVAPLLVDLVRPASVLDVGCGTGTWLAAFRRLGIEDVFGIDGGEITPSMLEIPAACFARADLSRPFDLGRRFDLALCLEVGEHLPAGAADALVGSLTAHAPVVAFSAAIPFQGGAGHVNEQWPGWWAARFAERGFEA